MMELRPFQKNALLALGNSELSRNHVLCIAPTGMGKSLIYETAASQLSTRTLLVTPLVALARQQYEKLKRLSIPVALGAGGAAQKPPLSQTGAWIISPEMLLNHSTESYLRKWKPNFLVVDECHCLWEWGENFRPAFSFIPNLLKDYKIQRSLWLTATLPFDARLKLREILPNTLVEMGHFDLPLGLNLMIMQVSYSDRASVLLNWIQKQTGPGIIFVPTREATLRISRLLQSTRKKVIAYHGGMSSEERKNIESLVREKIPDIVVATSAFGMGMDYPHLKYVGVWQAPLSLLSLVQTIGRVGRNTHEISNALVLWDPEDFQLLEWTIKNSKKRRNALQELRNFLSSSQCRLVGLKRYFDHHSPNICCNRCDVCARWKYSQMPI